VLIYAIIAGTVASNKAKKRFNQSILTLNIENRVYIFST